MKKSFSILSVMAAALAIITSSLGIFYSFGGTAYQVQNIYGESVTLYGDGIYALDSLMKVGAMKGTNIVVLIMSILLIFLVVKLKNNKYTIFLESGILSIILYASICMCMEITFNRLFLLYVAQFSTTLFAFILAIIKLLKAECFQPALYKKKMKGTGVFMIIAGCSVLVWLTSIIPANISGKPLDIIDIYTTVPTFVIDLGIILPICIYSGVMILKQQAVGYKLASVLLTLLTGVGLCVIFQTAVQGALGIILSIGEVLGFLLSFVTLGIVAVVLNAKLLKYAKSI